MTPRQATRDETDASPKPFSLQELVLHGKPNWTAAAFFVSIAVLHVYIAIHIFKTDHSTLPNWEALISSLLAVCFFLVAGLCILSRDEISICPERRQIHLRQGVGRFASHREVPFTGVRGVRVTLWQSRRGQQSRVEILCNGEEIPCPPTSIPRQQALYLAMVMNVRLIKVSDDRVGNSLVKARSF